MDGPSIDSGAARATLVKKVWTTPRLTVHGTLPAVTFAASVLTKTPP